MGRISEALWEDSLSGWDGRGYATGVESRDANPAFATRIVTILRVCKFALGVITDLWVMTPSVSAHSSGNR